MRTIGPTFIVCWEVQIVCANELVKILFQHLINMLNMKSIQYDFLVSIRYTGRECKVLDYELIV